MVGQSEMNNPRTAWLGNGPRIYILSIGDERHNGNDMKSCKKPSAKKKKTRTKAFCNELGLLTAAYCFLVGMGC